ncbi:hypothetical protein CRG98_004383 [Punica granatum]|uniref:Uncharacterized protein n=1 Tax=Punica granatum TaxID=22663 RepID=A0A2I0L3G2_PUNGR|nr:hypothetical protein CRG98_004383 [Punica granatum]
MAFFFSASFPTSYAISLTVLSTLFFFFFFYSPPTHSSPIAPPREGLFNNPKSYSSIKRSNGIINYFSFHYCIFHRNSLFSIPSLSFFLLFYFYVLIKTT